MALLAVAGLRKSYGGTEVFKGIDSAVERGDVLAPVGGNGACDSTPMRVVGGDAPPDAGSLAFEGGPLSRGVDAAQAWGIVLVHRGFDFTPHLTVAGNVSLGRARTRGPVIDRAGMERRTRQTRARSAARPRRARASRTRPCPTGGWWRSPRRRTAGRRRPS